MMLSPPQIAWEASGSPAVDGCAEADGRCWLCGGNVRRGMPWSAWAGGNFTDWNRVRCPRATHVPSTLDGEFTPFDLAWRRMFAALPHRAQRSFTLHHFTRSVYARDDSCRYRTRSRDEAIAEAAQIEIESARSVPAE